MRFCHFITFESVGEARSLAASDRHAIVECLAAMQGLHHALMHEPAATSDPYLNDGAPPILALQLYFDELAALEAASSAGPLLAKLSVAGALPSLTDTRCSQQAMAVRTFPVPDPRPTRDGDLRCTYLVAYEGTADDVNAWLGHYIGHHPPIMARFPGIREIEIYTRMDWCGVLPFPRVDFLQRNKVVFDSQDALTAALNSPVRHEMRADFKEFPPFSGRNTHYPMLTRRYG